MQHPSCVIVDPNRPPSPEHSSAFPPRPSDSIQLTPEQQLLIAERIAQRFHVESKGQLLHKSPGTNDFVTMADVLAQRIIGAFLLHRYGSGGSMQLPFCVVGEEDVDLCDLFDHREALDASIEDLRGWSYWDAPAGTPAEIKERERRAILKCLHVYGDLSSRGSLEPLDCCVQRWAAVFGPQCTTLSSMLNDPALRSRVGIFIDPIDGTNAFVAGDLKVPHNLVGITVDGICVASVVNQLFMADASGGTTERSLSYCLRRLDCPTHALVVLRGHAREISDSGAMDLRVVERHSECGEKHTSTMLLS
jgi:3'-phosphoadenosine 5'-phosphosulfate (PAPS) 3'-phosphatase